MAFPTHIVAAGGYVFDGKGNLLLAKTLHRGWDGTGGQVEAGENLEEAVLREILEESGVTATVRCLAGIYSNVGQHLFYDGKTMVPTKVMFDFICDYVSGDLHTSSETTEVRWVPLGQVMEHITEPVQRYRFEHILAFDGRIKYASYVAKPQFQLLTERQV